MVTSPTSSDPERPVTTPINTGSATLYSSADKCWSSDEDYEALADEMSPYFVGPMPVVAFLAEFLPESKLTSPKVSSFTPKMFESVVTQSEEAKMYKPFVCP